MRVLVTGGAGFLGSHAVDELVSRGHEVFVQDNYSTAELEDDGETPRFANLRAMYNAWPEDRRIEAVLHLALRHPLERERAVWAASFEGYVYHGVMLAMELLDRRTLQRFVLAGPLHRSEEDRLRGNPEARMVSGLRDVLSYWHRVPELGIYCAWFPELTGARRATEIPEGAETLPVERAAAVLADLTDGRAPHRLGQDVEVLP